MKNISIIYLYRELYNKFSSYTKFEELKNIVFIYSRYRVFKDKFSYYIEYKKIKIIEISL